MSDVLMIIALRDFQDQEYSEPKRILEAAGHNVVTASKMSGDAIGKFGTTVHVNFTLNKINIDDFEAIVFVGGPGAVQYQQDEDALALAKRAFVSGKIIGAICIAPTILAYAEVLEGKKAACWNGDGKQSHVIEQHGGRFVPDEVYVDGRIVTANGPAAAEQFGKELVKQLSLI